MLDGFQNLLPAEATRQVQNELSVLLDAYKRSEIVAGLGIYSLSSRLSDLAAPAEALRATVAWRLGPDAHTWLAGSRQLDRFRRGEDVDPCTDLRGIRGAHLAVFDVAVGPEQAVEWITVADTDLDSAAVHDLAERLADPRGLAEALAEDLAAGRRRFRTLLAGCDDHQASGDPAADAHHLACVAFNAMRGGVPLDGYRVTRDQVRDFLSVRNRTLAPAAAFVASLPDTMTRRQLVEAGEASGDPDLQRLTLEFLPLTFGRRHGDPSRPWNRFDIKLHDRFGAPVVGYQGNWRDIFQNWEALAWSYPGYADGMVATFVNATTIDGYNPYRITDAGIDWEEPEPENPWANIGYWSDHQIVYLTRLIDVAQRFNPGRLRRLLNRRIFTTADVPYRIAGLEQTLANPLDTIAFDARASAAARGRGTEVGGDGLLRRTDQGLHRSTLADKLLLLVSAKVANFVPDGGIWMNTQRPEWNDANNALVGRGASVVTAAQLLGYVDLTGELLTSAEVRVRPELAALIGELTAALASTPMAADVSPRTRRDLLVRLGRAGERYRTSGYAITTDATVALPAASVAEFLALVRAWLRATVTGNRRPDGLFHSYNTLQWDAEEVRVRRLPLMLEGQVAVLSSGLLDSDESLALLTALRRSALYRADQHSYLLYPDRDLPGFLDRNNLAGRPDWASLPQLLAGADPILVADAAGGLHFAADLANAAVLSERLARLADDPAIAADTPAILQAYEDTFGHRAFTGRSGSFFAYEGLGSIYWHMVSKLALAARECLDRARDDGAPHATVRGLADAYADIRSGLGFGKSAHDYGAFPTDPYLHTPGHTGARQPGMTGQVKEDILNRFAELGVVVEGGILGVDPRRVRDSQWLTTPAEARSVDEAGDARTVEVAGGDLAFTLCQVPFVVSRAATGVEVEFADGSRQRYPGLRLSAEHSRAVIEREGTVAVVRFVEVPG